MARGDRDNPRSIQAALDFAKWVLSIEDDQRQEEEQCLSFQDCEKAWPPEIREYRQATTINGVPVPARPMISVATLDEPLSLQASYERNATLSPRIHALSEDATDATAQVIAEIYRSIERDSNAQVARRWAYERTLWAGRGWWRVDVEYDPNSDHPLDQKIVIKRILHQGHVLPDPSAQEPDWSDALRMQVLYDLPEAVYLARYGKSKLARAKTDEILELQTNEETKAWIFTQGEGTRHTTVYRVCEDWLVELEQTPQVLLDDNTVADADNIPEGREKHPTDDRPVPDRETRRVFCRTINAIEELDPWAEWNGRYIPLIPSIGRELQPFQGRRRWFGMVQNARGAVRLTNYAASGAIETAAHEPRAPWLIQEGVDEGYAHEYQQANVRNFPALHWKSTNASGQQATPPTRVQVDVSRLGPNLQLLSMGQNFVQSATATHPPSLGQDTPAFRSGKAITALQSQSLSANSPYLDNFADISLMYEAKVILDLIPSIYDRPGRIVRLMGEEGKTKLVPLNTPFVPSQNGGRPSLIPFGTPDEQTNALRAAQDPNSPVLMYDLNKGRYGLLEVTVGKSYQDERLEGLSEMGVIFQADPSMMAICGPEYFEYRNEKWSDKVAAILKRNRDHTMPWLSDQPTQQANVQQLQAELQQAQQMIQHLVQERQGKVVEQQGKLQVEQVAQQAETYRDQMKNELKLAVATLQGKFETMQNAMSLFFEERARLGTQQHEVGMAAADAHATLQQQQAQAAADLQQQQVGAVGDAAQAGLDHANALQQATHQAATQAALQPPQYQPGGGGTPGGPAQ